MRGVPLKHLCEAITRGSSPTYSESDSGDALTIGQSCQRPDGSFDLQYARWHVGQIPSRGLLRGGEVLINSTGTGTLGRVALVAGELPGAVFVDTHVTMLRFHQNRADPRLMSYLMGQPSFARYVEQGLSVGATNQKELNVEALRAYEVQLPALAEQQRVAKLLDQECARMADLEKELGLLTGVAREYTASQRRKALQGDQVETALDAGRWPDGWPRLSRFVDAWYAGGTPSSDNPGYWTNDADAPLWVAIGDMSGQRTIRCGSRRLTPEGIAAGRLQSAPEGTLLLAMYASVGEVGELAREAYFNQALIGIYVADALAREFIYEWLVFIRPHLSWFTKSNTQANLTAHLVRHLPVVPISPLELAERLQGIRAAAGAEEDWTTAINAMRIRLREYRNALIAEAVTGKLDVTRVSEQQLDESAHAAMEGERPEVLSA